MLRKCLLVAFVFVALSSCSAVETPVPTTSISIKPTNNPLPSVVVGNADITIKGIVMDVSLSARIITLKSPVEGFRVLALTENCVLRSANQEEIEVYDIQPGMRIQASGQPGESDALLIDSILVLETTSMNGDADNPFVGLFSVAVLND